MRFILYCFSQLADFAQIDYNLRRYQGKYSPESVSPRSIPANELIVTEWSRLINLGWNGCLIIDEIEARYGSVSSVTIAQFAEEFGIQPSDRLMEIMKGKTLEHQDLAQLQSHLRIDANRRWTMQELTRLNDNTHQ